MRNLLRDPMVQRATGRADVLSLIVSRHHILSLDEAVAHVIPLTEAWPRDGMNAAHLAALTWETGDVPQAIRLMQHATTQAPQGTPSRYSLELRLAAWLARADNGIFDAQGVAFDDGNPYITWHMPIQLKYP